MRTHPDSGDTNRFETLRRDRVAELSDASAKILTRKAEMLARDFAELAALDAGLPPKEKRSMGLLLAIRPWVFSAFDGLRRKG